MLNDLTPEQKAKLKGEPVSPSLHSTVKVTASNGKKVKRRRSVIYWIVFAVIFIIISAIVSYVSANSRSFITYTAPDGSFSASFPGAPQVTNSSLQVQGISVPYTQYATEIHNDYIAYIVQVTKYPTSSFDESQNPPTELKGAISGMASSSGATLVSESDNESFQGYDAAEATLSVTQDGQTYQMYTMNFIKGNDLYTLITVGETKGNYTKFINSFSTN